MRWLHGAIDVFRPVASVAQTSTVTGSSGSASDGEGHTGDECGPDLDGDSAHGVGTRNGFASLT